MLAGVNSHGLNTTAASVVVGVLASIGLTVSGSCSAYVTAGASAQGAIATAATHVAHQIHGVNGQSFTLGTSATHTAVRHAANAPSVYGLPLTGKHQRYAIAGAFSSGGIGIDSAIAPNYLLAPTSWPQATLDFTYSHNGFPTKQGVGKTAVLRFDGYLFNPRIVTVWNQASVVSFKGFAIPANHLGYGVPTVIGLPSVTHDAVVLRNAYHQASVGLLPSPLAGVYNTAQGFGAGEVGALPHHNIKINNIHHFEQTEKLVEVDSAHTPVIFRRSFAQGFLNVSHTQESVTIRRAFGLVSIGGLYRGVHGQERVAAPIAPRVVIGLSGMAYGDVIKETVNTASLSLASSHKAVRIAIPQHEAVTIVTHSVHDALRFAMHGNSTATLSMPVTEQSNRVKLGFASAEFNTVTNQTRFRYAAGVSRHDLKLATSHDAIVSTTMKVSRFESSANGVGDRVRPGYAKAMELVFSAEHSDFRTAVRGEADAELKMPMATGSYTVLRNAGSAGELKAVCEHYVYAFRTGASSATTTYQPAHTANIIAAGLTNTKNAIGITSSLSAERQVAPSISISIINSEITHFAGALRPGEADAELNVLSTAKADFRTAVRGEADGNVSFLLTKFFPVTNPYSTAPQDRQLGSIPFDDRSMFVPEDNRQMVIT
jgi:hypothetical protein